MSTCNIDHSVEDVRKKLESQKSFLQESFYKAIVDFLNTKQNQETLNEVFHLLKKYDLATDEEQNDRNKKLSTLLKL